MKDSIKTAIEEFDIPKELKQSCSAVIPTVKANRFCNYGEHAYYFLNFDSLKGFKVTISHREIIMPGFTKFVKNNYKEYRFFPKLRSLFQSYHYDFNFVEQIMLMTVPHTVTEMGNGRYLINLWAYFGYLDIDCHRKTVDYIQLDEKHGDHVLGSQQVWDKEEKSRYYMTYSLKDSMRKTVDVEKSVACKIVKSNSKADEETIWKGDFTDYIHDIIINRDRRYCVVSELGMFKGEDDKTIPSKVLILDLKHKKEWVLDKFIVAAHAQFDPVESDIVYFSNHNFEFLHTNLFKALRNAMYRINFNGPASVFKYRLTENGPVQLAEFTNPEFFRLTNFHVFVHRGRKLLVAMGSPNYLYFADAETMEMIKRVEINHPNQQIPCSIGTFSPSVDGEKLFIHTTGAFVELDISREKASVILDHNQMHACSNHMITSTDISW